MATGLATPQFTLLLLQPGNGCIVPAGVELGMEVAIFSQGLFKVFPLNWDKCVKLRLNIHHQNRRIILKEPGR